MKWRFVCVSFVILALVLGTSDRVSVASGPTRDSAPLHADRSEATYYGGLVTPPLPKPQFTLTDTSGAPFDFWVQTQGYVTLLFFGYTHCPDECPLHMANIAMGLKKIPTDVGDHVKVVFVTTDPARDNPTVLRSWLNHFDRRFIGLTGSEAAVEAAQRAGPAGAFAQEYTVMRNTLFDNKLYGHEKASRSYISDLTVL